MPTKPTTPTPQSKEEREKHMREVAPRNVLVRNISPMLMAQLARYAQADHRTMQGEILSVLEQYVHERAAREREQQEGH